MLKRFAFGGLARSGVLGILERVGRGVPILARTAGLIAHLAEEAETPSGFALSYQATRELQYDGTVPEGFGEAQ